MIYQNVSVKPESGPKRDTARLSDVVDVLRKVGASTFFQNAYTNARPNVTSNFRANVSRQLYAPFIAYYDCIDDFARYDGGQSV